MTRYIIVRNTDSKFSTAILEKLLDAGFTIGTSWVTADAVHHILTKPEKAGSND